MGGVGLEEFCCTSLRTAVEFARPCSHGRREMFSSGQRVKQEEERVERGRKSRVRGATSMWRGTWVVAVGLWR